MIRQAAAVVVVLLLSPSFVTAQGTEMTVNVASASVHKSPTTASPVIGHASRGAKLQVTRNVGDWVKVSWPAAADGVEQGLGLEKPAAPLRADRERLRAVGDCVLVGVHDQPRADLPRVTIAERDHLA